jgi:hypothetical protein
LVPVTARIGLTSRQELRVRPHSGEGGETVHSSDEAKANE